MDQTNAKQIQFDPYLVFMGQTDAKHKQLIGSFVSTVKHGLPPG